MGMETPVETKVLCMGKATFIKEMVKLYGGGLLIVMVCLLTCSVVMAVAHDIRWIVVSLMLICIAAPMIMAFFYIYHGFKPVTVLNALPHVLRFYDDSLSAVLLSRRLDEKTGKTEYEESATRHLPYSAIKSYRVGVTSVIIPFADGDKGFIWLPVSAFDNPSDFTTAIDMMASYIRKNHNEPTGRR